jgi:hypothetical protein
MAERNSVLLPNDKNKLSDLINEQLIALNKAMRENDGNIEITNSIAVLQEGLKDLLKRIFEKKGVITPDETNEILDKVEETKRKIMQNNYDDSLKTLAVIKVVGIIVIAIIVVKLLKLKNGQ